MSGAVHAIANIFDAVSTPASSIASLSMLVIAVCVAIFVAVAGVLVYTIVRFRRPSADVDREPPQVYGSNQIEIAWTVIPVLIVIVLTMATARVITEVQDKRPDPGALAVTVVGHQWWWEIRYPLLGVVTANELHVPVSDAAHPRATFLRLESADVAHSFWVPQLAGKTDLIPNHPNTMWIEPTVEGTFLGNCAEFCGLQHANMLLRVVVQSPEEFAAWVEQQRAAPAHGHDGERVFLSLSCVNCHAVAGTAAAGTFGPDLSHVMSRDTLGAGLIPNTTANLRRWIRDPQVMKPGNLMPNMQLSDRELDQVHGYLSTLK
ncbi:MAG TPA: cytochrome c oxidase subunit II [Vicinamibacterales bacterium]|nr:cytochrome c oxidase subunit II [Vicinamibacterales bacterium]